MATAPYQYTFTVFTPCYNRAHTLDRVRESLTHQTFRDFEWLLVDDGSSDATRTRVESWQHSSPFPIRYFFQENQGKHVAFNRGVAEARGELFLTLDSDDACVPEALERFLYHWMSIPEQERAHFSAVTALCRDQHGRRVGTPYPKDVTDSDSLEIRYRYHVTGEKWGFQRTQVLRQFPYPETIKRSLVPEGIVWNAIARRYRTRFVNEDLRIYFIGESSPASPPVRARRVSNDAQGYVLWHSTILNEELDWFWSAPLDFLRSAVHLVRFGLHAGIRLRGQCALLGRWPARLLWVAAVPVGLVVYLLDRRRERTA